MKILIATIGSHGDVHPYLALGRELIRRGHAVTLATTSVYRDLVTGHGLAFVPIRPETPTDDLAMMRRIMHARRGPETVIRRFIMPAIRDTYADLEPHARQADLLVSHVLTHAVPVLAERLRKPWASTALCPMIFFSAHDPPVLSPLPWLAKTRVFGPRFNDWLFRQLKRVSRSWSRPVDDLRRELGLPPGADPLWEGQHSPHLVLAMFAERFGLPQPDWPDKVRVTGFPFLDDTEMPVDPELESFLAVHERPIVFTLGSSAVRVAGDFYTMAARAAQELGRPAVLVAGAEAESLQPTLPASITAIGWASFPGLFKRASAVVHPGGVGTTAQVLRAGIPQLVIPHSHDQFDNAERIRRMGCGRFLYRSRVTAPSLTRELSRLLSLSDAASKAQQESHPIRAENGAARAADVLIETFDGV